MITYTQAKDNQLDILSEDFTSSNWDNYVTYDNSANGQLFQFVNQSRKNLRSFIPVKSRGPTMLELNALGPIGYWSNATLTSSNVNAGWADNYDMTALLNSAKTTEGELWSVGTVEYNTTIKQNVLNILIPANTTQIETESSFDEAIDLTIFDASKYKIDFVFPSYPTSSIQSITVSLYSSTVSSPTSISLNVSNNKASINLSSISNNVLKGLNKIKLTITSNGTGGTFYCSQIICVHNSYKYPTVDWNTQTNRLTKTNQAAAFPTAALDSTTTIGTLWNTFPPMIKSYAGVTDTTIGDSSKDPQPVNINASMIFNTGDLTQLTNSSNQIGLILRETGDIGKRQSDLNALNQNSMPSPSDLSPKFTPSNNKANTRLYFASISWKSTSAKIKFEDENQTNRKIYYEIPITNGLLANTNYEFNIILQNNQFRIIINGLNNQYNSSYGFTMLELNALGSIGDVSGSSTNGWADDYQLWQLNGFNSIYDTGWIYDPKIQRRKGRFGWWANLLDNQSYIRKIAVNSASYAEYVSNPLKSKTPVTGVQIYSESSPVIHKFTQIFAFGSGAILSSSRSGEYIVLTSTSGNMVQGFCTNNFNINNSKLKIKFDLFVRNTNNISAYLLSTESDIESRVNLSLGRIKLNKINKINIILNNLRAGNYKLYIVQENLNNNQIIINNLIIDSPQLEWSARANLTDNWVDYDLENTSLSEGLVFSERGRDLQIRGVAKTQFASIKKVKSVPKYAELGARQWTDSLNAFNDITDVRLNKQSSGFYISTSINPAADGSLTKIKLAKGTTPSITDAGVTTPFDTYGLTAGTKYYLQGYLGSMADTWSGNVKYQWTFDDGTVKTGKSIDYTFNYAPDTSFTANEDKYCLHTVILKIYVDDRLINTVKRRFYVKT